MAWYKFEASHGPGHQNKSIKYEWYDGEESEDSDFLNEEWTHWVMKEDWEDSFGDVTQVDVLPEDVRLRKIKFCENNIAYARDMLKILGEVK